MRAAVALALVVVLGACSEDSATGAGDVAPDGGDPFGSDAAAALDVEADGAPDIAGPGGVDGKGEGGDDGAAPDDGDADPQDTALSDAGPGDADAAPGTDAVPDTAQLDGGSPDADAQADAAADTADAVDAADVTDPAPVHEVTVKGTADFEPWDEVLHLSLASEAIEEDPFIPRTAQPDSRIVDAFGGDSEPATSDFLLHVGPGCGAGEAAAGQVVVLVPGAGSDAQLSFVEPSFVGPGLALDLIDHGYCVFAVTFAHPFGRNQAQALVLATAIEQARLRTGQPQVQLIGHSKGGIVALTYVTGFVASMGAPYAGDVQQLYLLATPQGGMDASFRHPNFNYPAEIWALPMPSSWDMLLEWGIWVDVTDQSIYGEAFRGVAQLLAPWIEDYPLTMLEQDWYTTWHGGYGLVSHSLGIEAAIEIGGDFMNKLRAGSVPPSIEVHVGAGSNSFVNGVAWETAGPSDGLVFVESATDTTMLPPGTEVEVFTVLNHWEMVGSAPVRKWVLERLP